MAARLFQIFLSAVVLLLPGIGVAQSPAPLPRIGLLSWSSCANLPAGLMRGLAELGYIPGQTFIMACSSAAQSYDRLPSAASELVRLRVDIIVALSHPEARAARLATDAIPIVMIASGDPVAAGLVNSLARPGGNVTGLTYYATELTEKRLEMLREMVPTAAVIGVLANPAVAYLPFEEDAKRAAAALRLRLVMHPISAATDLENAFTAMVTEGVDAVFILPDLMLSSEARHIAELALQHRLPVMAWGGWFTRAGGLMAYSAEYGNMSRTLATYIDKILKGAKPGDIPIDQPTRFVLSINLKTAAALDIKIPQILAGRAEELIE